MPYGIYDIAGNAGWVSVGTDHDTAAFTVGSVRRRWNAAGRDEYPAAWRLLVTADAGGSNGYRSRAWKAELAALAAGTGLEITACHFPPARAGILKRYKCRSAREYTSDVPGRPACGQHVAEGVLQLPGRLRPSAGAHLRPARQSRTGQAQNRNSSRTGRAESVLIPRGQQAADLRKLPISSGSSPSSRERAKFSGC